VYSEAPHLISSDGRDLAWQTMAIEDLGNNGKCACFCGRLFSIAKSSVVAIEKRGVKPETKPLNPEQQILYRVVFISRPETWMKCIENLKFIDKHIKVSRDYTQQAIFAALNELESAQGFTPTKSDGISIKHDSEEDNSRAHRYADLCENDPGAARLDIRIMEALNEVAERVLESMSADDCGS
jgi:hypothetical protein